MTQTHINTHVVAAYSWFHQVADALCMLYRMFRGAQIQLKDDIGDLERLRLELTEPETNPSWFVHELRGEDQDTGDEFCVEINDWLRVSDNEDGVQEWPIVWPGIVPSESKRSQHLCIP